MRLLTKTDLLYAQAHAKIFICANVAQIKEENAQNVKLLGAGGIVHNQINKLRTSMKSSDKY